MNVVSSLPLERHPWSALLRRDDVVVDRGLLHLLHDSLTPDQARTSDLIYVAGLFEAAGIGVRLIRHDRHTPALVVDLDDREAAHRALVDACADEPVHIKPKRGRAVLAVDAPVVPDTPTTIRVYRPRVTRTGGLRYGAATGVRVQFWRFGDDLVEAPSDNVFSRRHTPAGDLVESTVEREGRTWRTWEGMFDPQPDEFTGDVDIVFSWVDGSSTDFQRQRAARMAGYVVGAGDDGPARYRHVDELRYALRSVHMYAPWVRRIFIATDSPAPSWLREHPKVTIVRSEEFFADPSTLPTHNSHAVEAQLHRIPGLAEHFLYSNDDMFFGRRVHPEMFFTPAGVTKFVECGVRIGAGGPNADRSGHDNGLRVNRALLRTRFGRTITRDLEHCATPLRRSVMAELEATFPEEFARTAGSRFRSATDISVTNSLYHYYALMTGRAVPTTRPRTRYVQTTMLSGLRRMERLAGRDEVDMFCLNDGGEVEVPEEVRAETVRATLEGMFPIPAPWERRDVTAGSGHHRAPGPTRATAS
ncbi:MAG: sugar phosphotransferase [Microbacterium sp.]|uniref:stealth family protein n=1 Tax=Microbacterium aquimaris TaxID=459816 RepID=UPI000C8A9828|nr:stealth family protein [Microbacterium aquimaris]MAP64481.1 sugar phosphotransferase [Microbacterium sp.]MDZ8277073.1 stealth family protein [Microbacterium aquimaris]